MKPIADATVAEFEEVALMGVKALRAFFAYQGKEASYFQKARLGAAAISAYARIRASETNRMAVEVTAGKVIDITRPQRLATRA